MAKFIATAPDGSKDFSRKSHRIYSHAILVKDGQPGPENPGGMYERERNRDWQAVAWVGRPELVQAQLVAAIKRFGQISRIEAVKVYIDA